MTAIRLAAAALALFASTAVLADDADKDKPINFSSDTGGYSKSTNGGDLTGNAIITQGTLTLHADRITFKVNDDNSVSAIAYGNPVVFRQRRQGTDEYDEAYAQRIAYDGQKQLVELFDRALLKRGPTNEMRSDYISYNRATDYASVGTAPGAATASRPVSRVTGVILPKDVNGAEQGKTVKPEAAPGKDATPPGAAAKDGKAAPPAGAPGEGKPAAPGTGSTPATGTSPKPGDVTPPPPAAPPPAAPSPLTIDPDLKSK
jgi:lipopolysaccharide export system protein LptA